MSRIQNVSRKDGTYYYRRLIRLGSDKPFRLRLSLRTMSHSRARIMAPALTVVCEKLRMTMIRSMGRDGLSAAQRAEIFKRQMLKERDRLEMGHAHLQIVDLRGQLPEEALRLRLDAGEAVDLDRANNGEVDDLLVIRIPPEDPNSSEEQPIEIVTWDEFVSPLDPEDTGQAAREHLAALGVQESRLSVQMARKVIHEARVAAAREYRLRLENPEAHYPSVPVESYPALSPPEVKAVSAPAVSSPASAPDSSWSRMTPTEAALKFIEYNPRTGGEDGRARKRGPSWTDKTREQFKLPALLLEQVMEGRPLAAVTHEDLVRLDNCFNRLHGPSFRKSERQRRMSILEIVDETDELVRNGKLAEDDIGLGIGTTNRHWGFLRQLTTWFGKHQPISLLDYSAFIVDDDRDPRSLRDTYTVEEGRALFSLPPWTGCASLSRRMVPGPLITHDSCYFVPLIAWYTGLRREEICGLDLDDLVEEDGHWHFDIRVNANRRLKTKTSKRLLPLARELVRLRLPEYAAALRAEGETQLFPEIASQSGKSGMGDGFYKKWWTKIAVHLPFLERGQAIQSFRHTMTDELKAKSVVEELRADLLGHRIQSETGGRYSKAARLSELRKSVAKVPEVTTHLVAPPLSILPARSRKPRPARAARAQ